MFTEPALPHGLLPQRLGHPVFTPASLFYTHYLTPRSAFTPSCNRRSFGCATIGSCNEQSLTLGGDVGCLQLLILTSFDCFVLRPALYSGVSNSPTFAFSLLLIYTILLCVW